MKKSISKTLTGVLILALGFTVNAFSNTESAKQSKEGSKKKILIVLSAASNWTRADGTLYPTGYWAEEFVVMHQKFVGAGYQVELATPSGVKPTADPKSLDPKVAPEAPMYVKYLKSIASNLDYPLALSKVDMSKYVAVVVPGGHGPVEDLYKDKDMGRILFDAQKADKIIGTVCHGQAALLSAVDKNGQWLFKGRTLTAFSDEEEVEFGTASNAPWLWASTLRKYGANYKRGDKNWGEFIVRDGNMISGQNPASTAPMAESVIAALSNKKILIVLSAAKNWTRADGTLYSTGYWAEEFVVMHEKFVAAGYDVDIATPEGKEPTADPKSLDPKVAAKAPEYAAYLKSIAGDLDHPLVLSKADMDNYAAVVVPGGHGPVEDLYKDKNMGRLLFDAQKSDKIIGTVCHGQAALLSAVDSNGNWLFKGRTLTAFSDEEEVEFGTASNAPWLLASTLRKYGANYKRGDKNWGEYIVRDGNMISGQNPASTGPMADAVVEDLNKRLQK
jgi:putative intracellular protease/amidase